MSKILNVLLGCVWCGYGAISLLHSGNFGASLLGFEGLHLPFFAIDVFYYVTSACLVPHYLTKSIRCIVSCLVQVDRKSTETKQK